MFVVRGGLKILVIDPPGQMCYVVSSRDNPRDMLALRHTTKTLEAIPRSALEVRMDVKLVLLGSLTPLTGYGKERKIQRSEERRVAKSS